MNVRLLLVYTVLCAGAQLVSAAEDTIEVEVLQHGKVVAVTEGTVELDLAPFDLVFELAVDETVLVYGESSPAMYRRATAGEALGTKFPPAATFPEALENPDEDLIIDSGIGQHAWWFKSETGEHRCSEVTRPSEDRYRCRRRISTLMPLRKEAVAVADWSLGSLYLVFLIGESSSNSMSTLEERRGHLRIEFASSNASQTYSLEFAQRGEPISATDGVVKLARAPFELRSRFRGAKAIYVHTSLTPDVLERARSGESLAELFGKGRTMALSRNNENEALIVKDHRSHQGWVIINPDLHSFTEVSSQGGDNVGRVAISNLRIGDETKPIAESTVDRLYLVFWAGELGGEELQRSWIELRFE